MGQRCWQDRLAIVHRTYLEFSGFELYLYWTGTIWSENLNLAMTFSTACPVLELIDYKIENGLTEIGFIVQGHTDRWFPI